MAVKTWVILVSCVLAVNSAPPRPGSDIDGSGDILYDQSQTGDYNIQISLKDIQIIALLGGSEEYTDYDYSYDYSELTIKPQNSTMTTPRPATDALNVTSATQNSTENLHIASTTENIVKITPPATLGTTSLNVSENVTSSTSPKTNSVTILVEVLEQNGTSALSSDPVMADVNSNSSKCVKGFRRTKNGECELKLRPGNINSLRKLVELSQRLKNRKTSEIHQRN